MNRPETVASARPLRLPAIQRARLERWARGGYPREACGLLVGETTPDGVRVEDVRVARNLERKRAADRYELDPKAFLEADREAREAGLEVVGFWHSHPDASAVPSETDRSRAWPGYAYVIVSVRPGEAVETRAWRLEAEDFLEGDVIE